MNALQLGRRNFREWRKRHRKSKLHYFRERARGRIVEAIWFYDWDDDIGDGPVECRVLLTGEEITTSYTLLETLSEMEVIALISETP